MARIISLPGSEPVGRFEQEVVERIRTGLPDTWTLFPNFTLKQLGRDALEYDGVLFGPHAVYVLEAKEWFGHLSGDDTEWLLNGKPRACPMLTVNHKAKVLKSLLAAPRGVWVAPVLVLPDRATVAVTGGWVENITTLGQLVSHLTNTKRVPEPTSLASMVGIWVERLKGNAGRRARGARRRFGPYETTDILLLTESMTEYRAKRAFIDDPQPYRVRVWHLDPYLKPEDARKRLEVIRRPSEAVGAVGPHDHLLQVLHIDELPDEHFFYEVTEWSDYGKLHTYLRNPEAERLTLRERLEIALGVARALEAVHGKGLVHRNVCPETILVGHDRKARLTDFDRAWFDRAGALTVFADVKTRNTAYLPPELENPADYDFDTASDMYSFGVLLYELLVGSVPFASPAEARAAQGHPRKLPSAARPGLKEPLDALVVDLLAVEDFTQRPSAAEVVARLGEVLEGSRDDQAAVPTPVALQTARFEPGAVVDGVYRIEAPLGSGAASQVYRIYHLGHERHYAMKLLQGLDQNENAVQELKTGLELPQHRFIARVFWQDRLVQPPHTPFVLSEYIEGETLEAYCAGRKVLPLRKACEVIAKFLVALEAIHPDVDRMLALKAMLHSGEAGDAEFNELQRIQEEAWLHRDIKPANLMLAMPSFEPKLIDFNIASKYVDASGFVGTPRYWAPDCGMPDWQPHHDLFSMGVVFYELVLHQHPYASDKPGNGPPLHPHEIPHGKALSRAFADFLHKAVQPDGERRFQSARAMRDALQAIEAYSGPVATEEGGVDPAARLTLSAEERNRSNYNPYVTRLLTLYSQARFTNAGTRGLDEIAKLTYVKTRLDERLAPEIVDGNFRLVLISGNAGDGKTAFLQQLEREFEVRGVEVTRQRNSAAWTYESLAYRSNYDASQDDHDRHSDAVLEEFFAPFAGILGNLMLGREVRLIAINEGRLLDFFLHGPLAQQFAGLGEALRAHLHDRAPLPKGMLLVNLNLRAVAVRAQRMEGADEGRSLVDAQLDTMLDGALWEPCEGCAHKLQCPIKHNVETLRDPASGKAVRERVRRLYEVVHLRRRQHVTMRDLRSSLSWLLLRDHGCDDVARLLGDESPYAAEQLVSLYYPDAFASDFEQVHDTVEDRLVKLLRETDVGQVEAPVLDRALQSAPAEAVQWMTFEGRSTMAWETLLTLFRDLPTRGGEGTRLADTLAEHRRMAARLRRWAYFERIDDRWKAMLPYRMLDLYESVAMAAEDSDDGRRHREALRDEIVEAVSLSEGVRHPAVRRGNICLRVSRPKAQRATSFRLFPKERFRVDVERNDTLRRYLEMAPDMVKLVADDGLMAGGGRAPATLRLTLDLLEMLGLIKGGYRPGPREMRGLFVNLMIFRNELLNLPFERVMVTLDQESFYEISARETHAGKLIEVRPVTTGAGVTP
jgi:serine/threonine protein kinase